MAYGDMIREIALKRGIPWLAYFPRSAVDHLLGAEVRRYGRARRWRPERLAAHLGVDRRTVIRLEAPAHGPTSRLIVAIEDVLDIARIVPVWPGAPRASEPCCGPRVRAARRSARVTAFSAASSVSPATFSRFERSTPAEGVVGGIEADDAGIRSDARARLLGFDDAAALNAFRLSGRSKAAATLARTAERRSAPDGRP